MRPEERIVIETKRCSNLTSSRLDCRRAFGRQHVQGCGAVEGPSRSIRARPLRLQTKMSWRMSESGFKKEIPAKRR